MVSGNLKMKGSLSSMNHRIISWNIDSINAALTSDSNRAKMSQEVVKKIVEMDPEVIAIQETKLKESGPTKKHDEILDELFPHYTRYWNSSKKPARQGYAGTMFLIKDSLGQPKITYPEINAPGTMDKEGRIITLEFDNYYITQVYTPNAGSGLDRLQDRASWDDAYRQYLIELDKNKPVIACGDYNVAVEEIDLANPAGNRNNVGFTDIERSKFRELLKAGFTDTFRHLHGNVEGAYTWWTQIAKTSKINNAGWRIDYFLCSDRIKDKVIKSEMIDSGPRQDHTPLLLEVDL